MMKRIACLIGLLLMLCAASACAQTEYRFTVDDLSVTEGLDPSRVNILLLGSDTRRDRENEGRADAIMVLSLGKWGGGIKLVSLARDMWVEIAGQSFSDKINTAFRYGGPDLMIKTVNETLKLNIEDYVSINFYGLCDVVDALGGIEITLTSSERSYVNSHVDWDYGSVRGDRLPGGKGEQQVTLCGAQALAFSRIRYLDNDLGRNRRQRDVIMAIFRKALALPPGELIGFVGTCMDLVSTDLSAMDIAALGVTALLSGFGDVSELSLPEKGDYRFATINGKSALRFELEEVQADAHLFLYGKTAPQTAE